MRGRNQLLQSLTLAQIHKRRLHMEASAEEESPLHSLILGAHQRQANTISVVPQGAGAMGLEETVSFTNWLYTFGKLWDEDAQVTASVGNHHGGII